MWHKSHNHTKTRKVRVVTSYGACVWQGTIGSFKGDAPPTYGLDADVPWVYEITIQPQEEEMQEYVAQQPLHIPRTSLITRLQERKAEEEQARQDAQDAASSARKALLEAVSKFSTDQVANILSHYVENSTDHLLKWVTEKQESKKFVTKDLEPTVAETQIDKLIRVLELAADDQIEVAPSDPLYPLL